MHNKIIKFALVLLTTASSIFAWTQAYTTTDCGYYSKCAELDIEEFIQVDNRTNQFNENINFINYGTIDYNAFYLAGMGLRRQSDGNLYTMYERDNIVNYAKVDNVCMYEGTDLNGIVNQCRQFESTQWSFSCQANNTVDISIFKNTANNGQANKIYLIRADGASEYNNICYVFENVTYCVQPGGRSTINSNRACETGYTIIGTETTNYGNGLEYYKNQMTTSPIGAGGGGGGGEGATTITTGTICPMIQFQIDMYGSKYNTGLCYTNTIEFTGGNIQTVTPKDIFEIFNSYTDYINRYNIRNNSCHAPYTQEYCTNVMSENWRSTQIFNKIEKAGVDSEKVYQYCHLQLHFTDEQKRTLGTCQIETETDQPQYATGTNQQNSNPNPLEGLTNALQNGTLDEAPVPNTGTVFDEILPKGVLTRKDVLMDYNFYKHFSMLYIKITKLFQARGEQEGILPPYITSLLLLILLFKIYKK